MLKVPSLYQEEDIHVPGDQEQKPGEICTNTLFNPYLPRYFSTINHSIQNVFFKKIFNWRIIALHCVAKLLCFVTFSQFTILCPIQYIHFGPHLLHWIVFFFFLVKAPCTCKNYKYNIHFSVVLCQPQLETLRRQRRNLTSLTKYSVSFLFCVPRILL